MLAALLKAPASGRARRVTRLATIAASLALLPVGARGQLPLQVSDRFVEVSRAVARTVLASELRKVCDRQPDLDSRERCHIFIDEVTQLFEFALASSTGSRPSLDALVTSLAGRVTQAAFLELTDGALKAQVDEALLRLARTPTDECRSSIAALRSALVRCGQSLLVDMGAAGKQAVCRDGLATPAAAMKACGFAAPATAGTDPLDVIAGAVTDWLGSSQDAALSPALAVQQLLLNRNALFSPTARGAFERVAALASQLDAATTLDTMGQWAVFDDPHPFVERLTAAGCSGKGLDVLRTWQEDRYAAYATVAEAMARGTDPTEERALARLPHGAGDFSCPPQAPAKPVARARAYAEYSRWLVPDVKTAILTDQVLWAALLGALALDYFQSGDAATLKDHVAPLALRAVARAIAYEERVPHECAPLGKRGEFACTRIEADGRRGLPPQALKIPDELAPTTRDGSHDHQYVVTHFVEARGSVAAAYRTCAWQAAAMALGLGFAPDRHEAVTGLCRAGEPGSVISRLESLLEADALLQPIAGVPGLKRWSAGAEETLRARSMVQGFSSPVRVFAALSRALGLASQALARAGRPQDSSGAVTVAASPPLGDVLASLSAVCDALGKARDQDALRLSIALGARVSRPAVDHLLDARVARLAECERDVSSPTTRCAARVLVDALYTPTVEYLAEPDPQRRKAFDWPAVVGHAIEKADPLSRSPLLFDVGLGFTLSMKANGDQKQGHLTVMEKFGIVKRGGARNEWQAGAFVGGFLDPVVRRIAGDKVDPRWLAGFTGGLRQWSRDFPLGIEAHAALAVPFQFSSDPQLAIGLVVLVPIDLVFK